MTQPFQSANRQYMIYADALSSVWTWWDMVTDPSYALKQELDLWEILHRDPKTRQAIDQRLNDVAGREYRIVPGYGSRTPGAKLKAALCDAAVRRIPHFASARRLQAQAVFRGSSRQLMLGRREMVSLADKPAMYWFMFTGLKHMDPRRFIIKPIRTRQPDGGLKISSQLHVSAIPTYSTGPKNKELWYGRYAPVNHPEWLVQTVYDDEESRLGHGRGIMDAMYFYHWAKQIVLREGLQGLERWAQGMVVYKFDPDVYGSTDGTQTTEALREKVLEQLSKMRSRHYFAAHIKDEVEVHTEGQQGGNYVMTFLEYLDRCIIAVGTGASLRSGGDVGAAGGFASDTVGQDLMDTVVAFDREVIAEDFRTDLIGHWCRVNRPQLQSLGDMLGVPDLADAPDPDFQIVQKRRLDPAVAMQRFATAMSIPGMRVKKSEIYEEQNWTQPEETDPDVFEGSAPAQIDPLTGQPIQQGPPGAEGQEEQPPEEGQEQEQQQAAPGPEADESLFGGGNPQDDPDLFDGEARDEAAEVPEGTAAATAPAVPAATPTGPSSPETPSYPPPAEGAPQPQAGTLTPELQAIAEAAAQKAAAAVKGGPSANVEIEGMEKQRQAARGGA